jgi:hypothetical protein
MYLRRKVDAFLEEWKADKNRKPLIVKGSRQIGKNNIVHEDRIYTFPYFCAFLLKRFMIGFHAEEEAE